MLLTTCTTAVALGLGLAADAVAVGAAAGVAAAPLRRGEALRMAGVYGGFQAVMPALGWLLGLGIVGAWAGVARWLAAGLLLVVAWRLATGGPPADGAETDTRRPFGWAPLLATGLATSIDALAAGIALAALEPGLAASLLSFAIIGLVTFACVWPAVRLGNRIGARGGRIATLLGVVALVAVAVRTLWN